MPKWLHDKLARRARKLRLTGERKDAYVYGTLQRYEKEGAQGLAAYARGKRRRKKGKRHGKE